MDNSTLGISFAPTADQAQMGPRRAGMEGLPEAIRILSLHMPRFLGMRAPVNSALVSPNAGAQGGVDPYLSALMQTLTKTIAPTHTMGLPGGTAGPNTGPYSAPPLYPSNDGEGTPTLPGQAPKVRTHWQDPGNGGSEGPFNATPIMRRNAKYGDEPMPGYGGRPY